MTAPAPDPYDLAHLAGGPDRVVCPGRGRCAPGGLDGRQAMPDARRRAEIFERPLPPLPRTSGMAGRIRDAGLHDPEQAAYRAQRTAVGGAAALGIIGGAAGDGGGS